MDIPALGANQVLSAVRVPGAMQVLLLFCILRVQVIQISYPSPGWLGT